MNWNRFSKNTKRLTLALLCLMSSTFALAEIYKWVDENGKVHFGDKKLQGKDQETVALKIPKSTWRRYDIRVDTFDVDLTPEEYERIQRDVNTVYAFFDDVLYFDFYKTVPVSISLYATHGAYLAALSEKGHSGLTRTRGVFLPKTNEILLWLQKPHERTFLTIKHETSHAIIATLTPAVPSWLNEGIAEQVETLEWTKNGLVMPQNPEDYALFTRHIDTGEVLGLKRFLSLPSDKWRDHSAKQGQSLYPQSAQFIYFLLSTSPDRRFLVDLVHYYARGGRKIAAYVVDDMAIGGIDGLQGRWNAWLAERQPAQLKF